MSKFDNIIRGTFNIATVVFAFSIIVMSIATITISDASDVSPSESQNFVKPAKAAMIDSGEIEAPAEEESTDSIPEREVSGEEPEVGKLYQGTVVTVKDYGAFVEFLPGRDGLCHVSELATARVKNVEDIAKVGEKIWVKLLEIDERGKVRLSRKAALEEREAADAGEQ